MSNMFDTTAVSKILGLHEEEVCEFVRDALSRKRLSAIVKELNADLLYGPPESKEKASQALARLGFIS